MEFKSGPIKLSVGAKPRNAEADRATLRAIEETLDRGDVAAAVGMAVTALRDGLEHPLVFNLAAEQLESEGRFEAALALLQRAHTLAPDDVAISQALALCLFRLQRFALALPHFDALVAAEPDFAPGHAARGATLDALGDRSGAEAAYRRSLALDPENLLAIAGLATLASQVGRHAEARALAERVLQVEPGYPEAVIVVAKAELAQGQTAEAEARLRAMIADPRIADSQRAFAHGVLAEIPGGAGRTPDA
jgi:tetratricopeptide (TPR) repeat protein